MARGETAPTPEQRTRPHASGLHLIKGGAILGRSTGRHITADDFLHDQVLARLSAQEVRGSRHRKPTVERPQTQLEAIVGTVLRISHADLYEAGDIQAVHFMHGMLTRFGESGPDLRSDKEIVIALEDMLDDFADTDLLRGMSAFSDAEFDKHHGTYEHTLVRPATRLATWMIAMERAPGSVD